MRHETVAHGTVTFHRSFAAPAAKVFAAWADPELRRVWGSPSEAIQLRIDAANFSVGGEDVTSCMMGEVPVAVVRGRYYDIVPDRRIVYTETIGSEGASEGVCLVSAEFLPRADGSTLVLTLQCAALDGADLLEGVQIGWTGALSRLAELVD